MAVLKAVVALAARYFIGCVRGTGRHCEEAGGDRQGCHAIVVLRGRYVGRAKRVHAAHGWRPGQGLVVHVLHERVCTQIQDLTTKPGPLDVAGIVGTSFMGSGNTMYYAEIGTQVSLVVLWWFCFDS